MSLCKFRDILGKPNEGFHYIRIGPFAFLDVLGTLIVSYFINKIYFTTRSYLEVLCVIFILGQFLHWLFCVDTSFQRIIKKL
jgi:hypothetical protein